MGGQHQKVDRPGLRDTKGDRRQAEVDTTGCEVIGDAPSTLRVKGLMKMMVNISCYHSTSHIESA